jgi:hypothetical protein
LADAGCSKPKETVLSRTSFFERLDEFGHLLFGSRKLFAERRFEYFIRDGEINIADGVVRLGVRTALDPAASYQRSHAVALVRIGLGILVDVDASNEGSIRSWGLRLRG